MKKPFVCILGLKKSGLAASKLLLSRGENVIGFDDLVKESEVEGLHVLNDFSQIQWDNLSSLIVSPGISPEHLVYKKAIEKGIEVIGEAELALRNITQPVIAITGTNGKTSVTQLITHILKCSGRKARALGNIGEPLSQYVLQLDPQEILVVELSSFQIETLYAPVFDAAVILNITPDHLDRYSDIQAYAQAKCNLQRCLKKNAPFFASQKVIQEFAHLLKGACIPFDLSLKEKNMDRANALAAWEMVRLFAVSEQEFDEALKTFEKPPHRVQFLCEINGVYYYDDSKGTNVDAVVHAVHAMQGPVILIAGGVDKGASYLPWAHSFKEKVKSILVLGQAAQKIEKELRPFFTIECVNSLKSAVKRAKEKAVRGDCVLLSPGCSSYDMFRDYVQRGEEFEYYVKGGSEEL